LKGEWTEQIPDENVDDDMVVTFQTGKGNDHLVPVMFPAECNDAIKYWLI